MPLVNWTWINQIKKSKEYAEYRREIGDRDADCFDVLLEDGTVNYNNVHEYWDFPGLMAAKGEKP